MDASAVRLEVVGGKAAGMSILVEDELVIGRYAEGAGRLAEDEEISRAHARVSLERSGLCAIEDLGSTNGTFVNGLRISGLQTLAEGDMIEIGTTTLVVRELLQPSPAQPTRSAPTTPADAPAVPPLSLQLEVDFEAREARLSLGSSSEPVLLAFDSGTWRPLNEKGDPE